LTLRLRYPQYTAAPILSWWALRIGLLSTLNPSKYAQQAGPHLLHILPGARATGSRCSITVEIGAPAQYRYW
jgi:hypothetical protein